MGKPVNLPMVQSNLSEDARKALGQLLERYSMPEPKNPPRCEICTDIINPFRNVAGKFCKDECGEGWTEATAPYRARKKGKKPK